MYFEIQGGKKIIFNIKFLGSLEQMELQELLIYSDFVVVVVVQLAISIVILLPIHWVPAYPARAKSVYGYSATMGRISLSFILCI